MKNTHNTIERQISRKKPGDIIFTSDFRGLGTDTAIKQALSRLTKSGQIRRMAHGIYYIPKLDAVLGELSPSADDVVQTLALREKIRVKPAGAYALHKLGLTTQVPTKRVYITDGSPRRFMLGKLQIKFKPTTPKRLMRQGKISSLVIQALEELGADNLDETTKQKVRDLLLKEDPKKMKHDLQLSSIKVSNAILRLLKEYKP